MLGNRPWKMAVGATAIALLAAGCSSGGSEDTDTASNTVVIGIGEPQHLIPSNATESSGAQVLSSLFYPLIDFDAQSKPVEVGAESVTSDDNKVWTIKLKPGFTFSNGEPVIADNFIDAWNYGAYGPNGQGASYFYERIEGYADLQSVDPDGEDGPKKAPRAQGQDPRRPEEGRRQHLHGDPVGALRRLGVRHGLHRVLPAAEGRLLRPPGVIADGFEDAIIGNGPFKMKGTWEHDSQIVVEKVDGFKGTAPKIDGVTWKIYQDQKAEYADLLAENVDVQTTIPIESLAAAPGDLGPRFLKSPSSSFAFVGFPTFQKEFAKKEVRQALSMAVNRQEMTDQIFLGSQTPSHVLRVPGGCRLPRQHLR
nr:hypothetical protein GCM10020092_098420 [Actinoplanes digitatis]